MPEDIENTFISKLRNMTNSQQSVQTTSLWVQFYQNKAKQLVSTWKKEILKAPSKRKITYLYLANDIIQTSRKKTMDFVKEFSGALQAVLPDLWKSSSDKDKDRIKRILDIFEQRKVYSSSFISNLRSMVQGETKKTNNPLVRAIEEADKVHEDNEKKDFKEKRDLVESESNAVVQEISRQENNLSSLPLDQLESLQNSFQNFLSDITTVRNGLEKELEKQGEAVRLIENELPRIKESVNTLKPIVSEQSERLKTVQMFLSKLQVHISVKSLVSAPGSGSGAATGTGTESNTSMTPPGSPPPIHKQGIPSNYDPQQGTSSNDTASSSHEPRLRSPPKQHSDEIFDDEAPPKKKQRKDNNYNAPSPPAQLMMNNPPPPTPDFNSLFNDYSTPSESLVNGNNNENNNSHNMEGELDHNSVLQNMDSTSSISNVGMNINNTPPFFGDN
eukprot:gb/GECH01013553.1/.p1 GENE.gb/GECH01013553.1/~~gb/GECH01013553.1/.p1  ORF type:complete len:445 (+),score=135.58 gb/GECH01013553.1/:1-1335(+)